MLQSLQVRRAGLPGIGSHRRGGSGNQIPLASLPVRHGAAQTAYPKKTMANNSMRKAPINKIIHILMQLVARFFVDIHHMSRLVICKADVLPKSWLELHVRDCVLDTVEGSRHIVVT